DSSLGSDATTVRGVLVGLDAMLLLIGLINLFTTALLGVREQLRDIGVLKTLGLTPRQVTASVIAGMGALATIAAAIGLLVGLLVTRIVTDALSRRLGWDRGLAVVPGAGTLLLAALGSLLPARRAASLQVADALRRE